ncbi:formimidoylglutamase [Alteromonas halophila]|uniref:Formimidoylglutamase n=1 Tax=Alteromonas halophila TaxID=516698 RepID=A0A918JMV4_9ALTE|nr:formimidoylglutamase [Alteromonas halophila]GGW88074.1 formimidoylglutamase [Alteromonas halophila]
MSFKDLWNGRIDSEDGEAGHRWHQRVSFDNKASQGDTVLIGYPNDAGVIANKGRPGASGGPNALRQSLASLPWQLTGNLIDSGDSDIADDLATTQQHFADAVDRYLNQGARVIGLGGGHDIAWGSWQGLKKARPDARIGIINLDAHLDLRPCDTVTSSGTPFRQIARWCEANSQPFHYACLGVSEAANTTALLDYAKASGTRVLRDFRFSADRAATLVSSMLDEIDELYVTVCMDAFPAASAPGVSAPAALGIPASEVVMFLRWLGVEVTNRRINWRLSDIAELNPSFDKDHKTSRLAARMGFELARSMPSGT